MIDIATSMGISTRDVALVLAADPRVPREVRKRITEAMDVAGYRPLQAVQEALGRPLRLAVVFKMFRGDDPDANRFYMPIASAIAVSCFQQGAQVLEATVTVNDQYELLDIPSVLTDGSCDGAFLLGVQLDAREVERFRNLPTPCVLVDGYSAGGALDSVVADNVAGAASAVEHLVSAGHRAIAMLGTEPICYPSVQARRGGYAEAMEARGLRTYFIDANYVLTQAVAVMGVEYLQRNRDVTAVFGANDLVTLALMRMARDAGIHCPTDISLIGFDDIDLASLVMPALTTLAIDKALVGRAGFALLAHRLEVGRGDPVAAVVSPRLVERESVGPQHSR